MELSLKVKSILISASDEKTAYIKGCKQLAKYIASSKYKNLTFKANRTGNKNEFEFTVFTNIDLRSEQKAFCKICKEFHCNFYINEEYNCKRCNLRTFLNRAEEKAKVSKSFYKNKL